MSITLRGSCPDCSHLLAEPDDGAPWCPECEWNLATYDPVLRPPRGWAWIERLGHRKAYALDNLLITELRAHGVSRPGWTKGRVALVVISLLLCVLTVGLFAAAVVLFLRGSFLAAVSGLLCFAAALVVRPRVGRPPGRKVRVPRESAPTLYAVLDRVAASVGTAPPDFVVVDRGFNAAVGRSGWRRRSTLYLGAGLWVLLDDQERVALLAHELGHLVNGDPTRGFLVQPALASFARLADWTGAQRTLADVFSPGRRPARGQIFVELPLWLVSRVFLTIHLTLTAIGLRDHHRSEYLADAVALRVAGSDDTRGLLRRLCFHDVTNVLIGYGAESRRPLEWRALIDHYIAGNPDLVRVYSQLSMRRADLWSSHPPMGARFTLAAEAPFCEPEVVLTGDEAQRIDNMLARTYQNLHNSVLGTRTFRPRPPTADSTSTDPRGALA